MEVVFVFYYFILDDLDDLKFAGVVGIFGLELYVCLG